MTQGKPKSWNFWIISGTIKLSKRQNYVLMIIISLRIPIALNPIKCIYVYLFVHVLLHVIKLTSVYNFVQPIALRVNSNACKFAVRQYQFFATMETRAEKSQSRRVQEQHDQFRFASYNDWSRGKTEYRVILILFDAVRVLCVLPNWRNYNGNFRIYRKNLREKPQRGSLRQNISLSQFNFGI